MDEDELKAAIIEAGEDQQGIASRKTLCFALVDAFKKAGQILCVGGSIIGPDRVAGASPFGFGSDATFGLGMVVQIAGELSGGVVALLEEDNRYGAAALLRQLVEAEYLTWAFAEDQEEAMKWLRSSRKERMQLWQPRHIYNRAGNRFRGVDYGLHCEQGGHPAPAGIYLLPTHSGARPDFFSWNDLAGHGLSAWDYTLTAVDRLGYGDTIRALPEAESLSAAEKSRLREDRLIPLLAEAQSFLDDINLSPGQVRGSGDATP